MRALLFILVTGAASASQPYVTNQDGSVLYFSSSLRLKGTAQYFHPKIFVWEQGKGVRLYEQRASDQPASTLYQGFVGNQYFQLERMEASSDNSTVAVLGERVCTAIGCGDTERWQTTIHATGRADVTLPGDPVLSRNGRFAALTSSIGPGAATWVSGEVAVPLVDLVTGQQTVYHAWPYTARAADDGTVVMNNASGLALGRNGQVTNLGFGGNLATINASATAVLYSPYLSPELYVYSIPAGTSTKIADSAAQFFGSDDGSVIAYTAPQPTAQAWVVRSDGTARRQLTAFTEGAYAVAISGDGRAAFVRTGNDITGNNRIVRIDVASGEQTEIVPAMPGPFYSAIILPVLRGGLEVFGWNGLQTASTNRLTVRIKGDSAPIASVEQSGRLTFQIPWDLPDGYSDMEVDGPYLDTSLFAAGGSLAPLSPGFFTMKDMSSRTGIYGPDIIVAAHQDFSALITDTNRAQAGEVVHLYGQNLGAVSALPGPGLAASGAPPSFLSAPVACVFSEAFANSSATADVLFAGLAPGMFGVYQLDLRLPPLTASGWATVSCHVGTAGQGVDLTGYLPFQAGNRVP